MKVLTGLMAADGQGMSILNKETYLRFAASCEAGTEWEYTIRPKRKRQSSQVMRYYRGVVVPDIAEACGYSDPDDFSAVHESLAWKFLRIADHAQLGFPRRRSTAKGDMAADEMSVYVNKCIDWAESSIPGCRVRRPGEIGDWDGLPMVWQPDSEKSPWT